MVRFYKIFRALVMAIVVTAIFVPAAVYVVLSTDTAMKKIRDIAVEELSDLLGTDVEIEEVVIQPFNKVAVSGVSLKDDFGKQCLTAKDIEARFEFWNFVTTGNLVFDYAVLDDVDIRLYRESASSPLNIQNILSRLKSDSKDKEPTRFDIALYTLKLQDARFSYDVLDKPELNDKFDVNHIRLSDVELLATAPVLSDERIACKLRELSFTDISGFKVSRIAADVEYTPSYLNVGELTIDLPSTHFSFDDINLQYGSPESINRIFNDIPLTVAVMPGSYFTLSDFTAFVPAFENVNRRFDLAIKGVLSKAEIDLQALNIREVTDGGLFLDVSGLVHNPFSAETRTLEHSKINCKAYSLSVRDLLKKTGVRLSSGVAGMIDRLRYVDLKAEVSGRADDFISKINVSSPLGEAVVNGNLTFDQDFKNFDAKADFDIDGFDVGTLLGDERFGSLTASAGGTFAKPYNNRISGTLNVNELSAEYLDDNLILTDSYFELNPSGVFEGKIDFETEKSTLLAYFEGNSNKANPRVEGKISVDRFNPQALQLINRYEGYELDVDIDFDLAGDLGKWIDGYIDITNLYYRNPGETSPTLDVKKFNINADSTIKPNVIDITSDFLNGTLEGELSLLNIVPQIKNILWSAMPELIGSFDNSVYKLTNKDNDFRFDFEINNAENVITFFNLPVNIIYPVNLTGKVNSPENNLSFGLDAPYLMKGDMIIEQTTIEGGINGEKGDGIFYLTSQFPTKKGMMSLASGITIHNDIFTSEIDWEIERDKPIKGKITFDTEFSRDVDNGKLCVDVNITPCDILFGNDTWHFEPSSIAYKPGYLDIDNFVITSDAQSISIDGTCNASEPGSEVIIELKNVVLNTIFETLDINKALIGGVATGTLHAGGIFDETPFVTTDNLHVDNIGYNYCVLGDGDISAHWDNERKSFYLDAIVSQPDERKSHIYGEIFPTTESLDITFNADKVKVGFMKPFMEAFADDITGYASGRARLFGTFKYIDMEGDIFAEDLGLKVGFTNTWYYATDSIRIVPGLIDIKDITIHDVDGHDAKLNGVVKHNFFKDPVFDFKVTDAKDFLCYDVTPALSPDWYGKVYGNGSAFITGSPGVVNIDVNMSTAENSVFTFVLSDTEEAEQYSFLTFRDKNRNVITDTIIQKSVLPEALIQYRERMKQQALMQNPPSVYNMNIQMDITPAAKIIIVMDPVGGDEIKSWGRGNMRMTYTSVGSELRMYGTYAIDRGSYNFTLQDIIVKDFIIKEGSSITFTGDPYNAMLDITASYVVNANLSDLDESFTNDPELNRTNVPVHALLLVKGDMRQPDIDFDLEFPTLTSDVYRKVKSIISTDEMMNRQMIYLLALNRFYTPEYMNATRGNELFSVASSTISSRLSSMLGKLSENWTISPNLRSDKGDFSDVQFDVALSSNLLNNRLRMNGNFGYRDKSLNTTQFIGDFDLEYLLNRSGSWRLKAYNRFNDQTYFLRTAKTTQGVGIKFQREFDNLFGFLKFGKKKEQTEVNQQPDSIPVKN